MRRRSLIVSGFLNHQSGAVADDPERTAFDFLVDASDVFAKDAEAKAKAVMEERILALLPKKYKDERWGYLSVYSTGYGPNESGKKKVWVDARFSGDGLDIILALAEQGAAAAALS